MFGIASGTECHRCRYRKRRSGELRRDLDAGERADSDSGLCHARWYGGRWPGLHRVTGALTFAPGDTGKTVSVPIVDDALVEPSETFTLQLSNSTIATFSTAIGTGTVIDNDVVASINNVTVVENVEGGVADFTVRLSSAITLAVSVSRTVDGSAVFPGDYAAIPLTTLTFAPGQTSKTVAVAIVNDALIEGNQNFTVV